MNGQEMLDSLRLLIKEPYEDHYTNASLLTLINRGRNEVTVKTEALEGEAEVVVSVGSPIVTLPATFLAFKKVRLVGSGSLPAIARDSLADGWQDIAGTPTNVIPLGVNQFRLYPEQEAEVTLGIEYIVAPAAVASADATESELPEMLDSLAVMWAAYQVFDADESPRADRMLARYQQGLAEAKLFIRRMTPKEEDMTVTAER
jgi:hypothetical protein